MKIKLDENLPDVLVEDLGALGHDVHTVKQEQIDGEPDPVVFEHAQAEGRFLITQDLHFSDARQFEPGTHAGIVLVRLKKAGREALRARVLTMFIHEGAADWGGYLVVATEAKTRIRRPGLTDE